MVSNAPDGSPYHKSLVSNSKSVIDRITLRCVQHFVARHKIVLRAQTGKLQVSPQKEEMIEKQVAFHLGELKRGFEVALLCEDSIENADETHFVFNMENGRTLGFKWDKHVKYADVVSGGDPITMMVRLTGGRDARIETPMPIFKNASSNYPIPNVENSVPGACYRTGPKGWIDKRVLKEWLSEPRAIKELRGERKRFLFVDNCSSHITTEESRERLKKIRTMLQKFPGNATHLVQPPDSFVIQNLKDAWRTRWDQYKYNCIEKGLWQNCGSGKISNPGKRFFLQMASDAVKEVNAQRDKNGVQYVGKAMIMTGMTLNLNGLWEEKQLSDDLQAIVAKHRRHFDGEPVESIDIDTETDDEE